MMIPMMRLRRRAAGEDSAKGNGIEIGMIIETGTGTGTVIAIRPGIASETGIGAGIGIAIGRGRGIETGETAIERRSVTATAIRIATGGGTATTPTTTSRREAAEGWPGAATFNGPKCPAAPAAMRTSIAGATLRCGTASARETTGGGETSVSACLALSSRA